MLWLQLCAERAPIVQRAKSARATSAWFRVSRTRSARRSRLASTERAFWDVEATRIARRRSLASTTSVKV